VKRLLALAAVALTPVLPTRALAAPPAFAVLGVAAPPGYPVSGELLACVHGDHRPGQPVLALPEGSGTPCRLTTGAAGTGFHTAAPCALLTGPASCASRSGLALVGVEQVAFTRLAAEPIRDPALLRELGAAIARSGVVARAVAGWRASKLLGAGQEVGTTPLRAIRFTGLPTPLTLVKLPVASSEPEHGPWLAIEAGTPATIVGPYSFLDPAAFTLESAPHVHITSACCTGCGDLQDDVYALEGGRLRLVFHASERGN